MSRQTKLSKKGVSVMIGYILLVTLAVIMGGIIYTWMKSYVPQDKLECPQGTSISIASYDYNCSDEDAINLTIKNNGRFDIAGYFIRASDQQDQVIANVDISQYLLDTGGAYKFQNSIVLSLGNDNSFTPGLETINKYDLTASSLGDIKLIEVVPVRWQKDSGNKLRYVSCGADSNAREEISCSN